jgi:hypothetical protein
VAGFDAESLAADVPVDVEEELDRSLPEQPAASPAKAKVVASVTANGLAKRVTGTRMLRRTGGHSRKSHQQPVQPLHVVRGIGDLTAFRQ